MRKRIYSSTLRPKKKDVATLPENWEELVVQRVNDYLEEYLNKFYGTRSSAEILHIGEPYHYHGEYSVTVTCVIHDVPVFYLKSFETGYDSVNFSGFCDISFDGVQVRGFHPTDNSGMIPYTLDQEETISYLVSSDFADHIKDSLESLLPYPGLDVSNIDVDINPTTYSGIAVYTTVDMSLTEDPIISEQSDFYSTFGKDNILKIGFVDKATETCCNDFKSYLESKLEYFQKIHDNFELRCDDLSEVISYRDRFEAMVDTARFEYPDISFDVHYAPRYSPYLDDNGQPKEEGKTSLEDMLSLYCYTPLAQRNSRYDRRYTSIELVIGLGNYENTYQLNLRTLPSEKSFARTIQKKVNELREAAR